MIIVLPVYNRLEITRRFVGCLQKQSYQDYTVYVFDDGTDGTGEMVSKEIPGKVKVFKGDGHWYWGGGLRYAFDLLQNEQKDHFIMLANDDLMFEGDYLETAAGLLKDNLLVSTTIHEGGEIVDGGIVADWKRYKFKVGTPIDCASTRGLFLTLNTWKKIGTINRFLLMHGDYEFTLRAVEKGIKIIAPPNLVAFSTDMPEQKKKRLSVFSKLHPMNPFQHTVILFLHCPLRYLPLNLARIWGSAFWKTLRRVASQLGSQFAV